MKTGSGLLFILLFNILSPAFACAQSLEQTIQFADDQYKNGNYKSAIKLYNRIIYFSDVNMYEYYQKISECYFNLEDYRQSNKYLDFAYFTTKNDSIKNELIFRKTTNYILLKAPEFALMELYNVNENLSPYFRQKANFYYGVIYFKQEEFEQSKLYFAKLIDNEDTAAHAFLDEIFQKNKKAEKLNPKTVKYMSMIMPGSGQFYIGDVKNGFNSLLLTGGFVVIFARTATNISLVDAIVSVYPWYSRYHQGGFKNAELLAQNKKQQKYKETYNKIIDLLYQNQVKQEQIAQIRH